MHITLFILLCCVDIYVIQNFMSNSNYFS